MAEMAHDVHRNHGDRDSRNGCGKVGWIWKFQLNSPVQGYSYDQRLENVDIDFNDPLTPIVGLGQ